MRVPVPLAEGFGEAFDSLLAATAAEAGLLPSAEELASERFLARSVVPHVRKLSDLFNRIEARVEIESEFTTKERVIKRADDDGGLDPYWKSGSNPANLRLAYFLYFMPSNLFRVAAVWSELARLGFRWPFQTPLRGIEFGAGPAAAASGIAAGERHAPVGLPPTGNWALIEQDRAVLELGSRWLERYFPDQGFPEWGTKPFHRRIDPAESYLPRTAPAFQLWLMSYFLNESTAPVGQLADTLLAAWERHLEEEGIAILVEPALRPQSRRLLELRKELLARSRKKHPQNPMMQVLLPCLGHQSCGALADPEDWCHEEASWWRPPLSRRIDKLAGLDRKTLPFSYLVVARSRRPLAEILPGLAGSSTRHRLVSPAHAQGRDGEFFLCGQEGKLRARYRPEEGTEVERGSILLDAEIRGDTHASRVERLKGIR